MQFYKKSIMKFTVFDIETDGLLDKVSKIHCLSFQIYENNNFVTKGSITDCQQIKNFFQVQENLVGHNIIKYDLPVLEKLLDVDINSKIIDTLAISYYLYPYRKKHGLESWGEDLGFEKPKIEDWENQSIQDYIHRCESDVEINSRLFIRCFDYLLNIYGNLEAVTNFTSYLGFKMDCLREQEEIGITLDRDLTEQHLYILESQFEEKTQILTGQMPKELGKVIRKRPKTMFKANGDLSVYGKRWVDFLKEQNLPEDVEIVREEPNPGSDVQLKSWLFSLGWKPITFKVSKSTGNKIPQVSLPFGQGICSSVKDLYEVEPLLEELEGYFKIKHRIGVFKSFLKNVDENGKVYATAHGFTNTLRLTHSEPAVNLPKPGVYYGKEIREVLTIPNDDYIMCGSDVSGLEDNTKQHYIFFHDPDYVTQMRVPGFDPHVDIGVLAGLITKEEESLFKEVEAMSDEERKSLSEEELSSYKAIKNKRGTAKSANFAATYGAGGPKIAETAKISLKDGHNLHKTYWERNWAVKKIAEECFVKEVLYIETVKIKKKTGEFDVEGNPITETVTTDVTKSQKWLYNPLSGFWLFLKAEKDRFSTLNQNTGVFVFDNWVHQVRKRLKPLGIQLCLQYHDEILLYYPKEHKDEVESILRDSMRLVNEKLNLNVEINISIDYGRNYSECH